MNFFTSLEKLNIGNSVTADIIQAVFTDIHIFSLAVAFLLFCFAAVRNYKEYGDHLGIHFIVVLGICILCAAGLHKVTDALLLAISAKIEKVSSNIESIMLALQEVKFSSDGNFFTKIFAAMKAAITEVIYYIGVLIGRGIRTIVFMVIMGIYNCLICFAPIFVAFLTIPETKSIGVNYLTHVLSFVLMPVCFLFGDITMLYLMDKMWTMSGMTVTSGSGAIVATKIYTLVGGSGMTISGGIFIIAASFAIILVVLSIICYVGLPLLFVSIFRGGGVGSVGGLIGGVIAGAGAGIGMVNGPASQGGASAGGRSLGSVMNSNNSSGISIAKAATHAAGNIISAQSSDEAEHK